MLHDEGYSSGLAILNGFQFCTRETAHVMGIITVMILVIVILKLWLIGDTDNHEQSCSHDFSQDNPVTLFRRSQSVIGIVTVMILVMVILKLCFAGHSHNHRHTLSHEFSHGKIVTLVYRAHSWALRKTLF